MSQDQPLNGKLLADISAAVARIDERTSNLPERLAAVENACAAMQAQLAHRDGLDVGRDEKLSDLKRTASVRGAVTGGGAGALAVLAQFVYHWLTGRT